MEKGFACFAIDFLVGGVSAAVSETAAAPIERVKLLIQNQDEMIKTGRLSEPYKGITGCFAHAIKDEGTLSLLERKQCKCYSLLSHSGEFFYLHRCSLVF